tara:strand:+ start:24236 stop:24745 length:510 start_codon:yes stop_codon:yes gene_type:complete
MKKAILLLALMLVPQPSFAQDEDAAPAEVTTEAPAEEAEVSEGTETPEAPAEGEESAEDDGVPETVEEAVETGHSLYDAIHAKNWTLVFAFSVMILVFVVRKLGLLAKLPGHAVVWVSVGIGVLVSVASGLISGLSVLDAVLNGAVIGLSGSGLWSAIGKHVTPSSSEE